MYLHYVCIGFGAYLIEHCLLLKGIAVKCKVGHGFNPETGDYILKYRNIPICVRIQ